MVVPCPAGWPPLHSNDSNDWGVFADYVVDYPVRYWRTQEERLRRIAAGLKVMPRMVLVGVVDGTWGGFMQPNYPFNEDFWLLGRRADYHLRDGEIALTCLYGQELPDDARRPLSNYSHLRWWTPRTALRLDRRDIFDTGYLTHPGDWPGMERTLAWAFFNRVAQAWNTRPLPPGTVREAS